MLEPFYQLLSDIKLFLSAAANINEDESGNRTCDSLSPHISSAMLWRFSVLLYVISISETGVTCN